MNINKFKIIGIVFLVIVAGVLYAVAERARPSYSRDPHVDPNTGWYIPFQYTGTFKNVETGKIFDYVSNGDQSLENCIASNCKYVYFFVDKNGKVDGTSLDDDANSARIRAKIVGVTISDKANDYPGTESLKVADYLISYTMNGKTYRSHYQYDLCATWYRGERTCYPSAAIGDPINIAISENGSDIRFATFVNTIEAAVLRLEKNK